MALSQIEKYRQRQREIMDQIGKKIREQGSSLAPDQVSEGFSEAEIKEFAKKMRLKTNDQDFVKLQEEYFEIEKLIDAIKNPKKQSEITDWTLKYPKDLDEVPYKRDFIVITFYEHQTDVRTNEKLTKIIYPKIKMPLSSRLFYSSLKIQYSADPLGQFNNVLFENAREYGATSGGIKSAISNSLQGEAAASATNGFMMSQLLRTDLAGVAAGYHGSGLAYNENTTALFQGKVPQTRDFFPSWTFVPKNPEDARCLSDIIKAIKKNSLPKIMNNFKTDNSEPGDPKINYNNHFKYPRLVKLQVFVGGKEFKKARFLPMTISRFEVSNNDKIAGASSDNVPLSKDGDEFFYTETTLNMTFKELTAFTRDHVDTVFQIKN